MDTPRPDAGAGAPPEAKGGAVARVRGVLAWWQLTRAGRANARFGAAGGGVLTGGIAYAALFSVFAALTIAYTAFVAVLGRDAQLRQDVLRTVSASLPGLVDTGSGDGLVKPDDLVIIIGYGQVAGPDSASLLTQPSNAIKAGLAQAGLEVSDVDVFEINEAFAAVGCASMTDLGIDDEKVNVNGGAIALGHPLGMSGNRITLSLLHELKRRGGGVGAAGLCGGGGQGDAIIVRV